RGLTSDHGRRGPKVTRMTVWSVVLIGSLIVLGVSAFGMFARRARAGKASPVERDGMPASLPAPGAPRSPMPSRAAPAPMPRAAAAPNWNAIGAVTGVLGLIVSVIGLFKG